MVKRVVWSERAQFERKEILNYWFKRNGNKSYSKKLNRLFKEAIQLVIDYPELGKRTNIKHVKVKIIRDYMLFYEFVEDELHILSLWDSRQNPARFNIKR